MTRRPLPHGIDRATLTREIEPIRTQAEAQRYGGNVHSIASARDRRDGVIWSIDWPDEEAVEPRRPTLAEILGDTDPWLPGGGAAA